LHTGLVARKTRRIRLSLLLASKAVREQSIRRDGCARALRDRYHCGGLVRVTAFVVAAVYSGSHIVVRLACLDRYVHESGSSHGGGGQLRVRAIRLCATVHVIALYIGGCAGRPIQ